MASPTYYPVSEARLDMDKDNHESSEQSSFSQNDNDIINSDIGDSDNDSYISYHEKIEQTCISNLLHPPLASYPTCESLQEVIRTWTRQQGSDLVVSRSYKHNSKIVRRCLEHDRAGKSQNNRKQTEKDRKIKTTTHKIGCSMGLYVANNREDPEGSWSIKYKTTVNSKT